MINLYRSRIFVATAVISVLAVAIGIAAGRPSSTARGLSDVDEGAPAAAVQPASSTWAAAQPASAPEGSGDGIKVHGHWTITVLNPDGSIADLRDFENGFSGWVPITKFLTRGAFVGYWEVFLTGNPTQPCVPGSGPNAPCIFAEPATGLTSGGGLFANLQVTSPISSTTGMPTIRLAGTGTVDNTTSIDAVATYVGKCSAATPSVYTCSNELFTYKTLTANSSVPPIAVQAGQQIQLTVVISFS